VDLFFSSTASPRDIPAFESIEPHSGLPARFQWLEKKFQCLDLIYSESAFRMLEKKRSGKTVRRSGGLGEAHPAQLSNHWNPQASEMQLTGQTGSQAPQSMQSSALMKRFSSLSEIHSTGQTGSQAPQLIHSSLLMIRGILFSFFTV
jgi:hypothetical protein